MNFFICSEVSEHVESDENDGEENDWYEMLGAYFPERKVRIRSCKRNLAPKIFKSDIRRQYVQMLLNVINSADCAVMSRFFQTYASPDITLDKHCIGRTEPFNVRPHITVQGIPQLSLYWSTIMKILPDNVVTAEDVQIITTAGSEECRLVCKVCANFTQYYTESGPTIAMRVVEEYHGKGVSEKDEMMDSEHSASSEMHGPGISTPVEFLTNCKPLHVLILTNLTIQINAQKQIAGLRYRNPIVAF